MSNPKPKSRKVAWVVLGVVVLGAALSIALVWDVIWLEVAYVSFGPPVRCDSWPASPANAHTAQSYSLRYPLLRWFPGHFLLVYYDQTGREILREPEELVMPGCK